MWRFERTGKRDYLSGTSASFNVSATGTGLGYQWYKGGSVLTAQDQQQPGIDDVTAADADNYSVWSVESAAIL